MDRISDLPDNIVETIIRSLPLRDAVRTSILSKQLQYKWAALSKLSLDHRFYCAIFTHRTATATATGITYPCLVKTILLQHIGRLETFHIYIPDLADTSIGKFNLAIRVALMKGVKELTVWTYPSSVPYQLPSFLFSCGDQLTKLKLTGCAFNPPHGLRVFSNLRTLHLRGLEGSNSEILCDFISSCPKLHTVELTDFGNSNEHLCIRVPSVKVFTIAGDFAFASILFQEPLNLVSLEICVDIRNGDAQFRSLCEDYMHKLFSNLGKLEYLSLAGYIPQVLGGDFVPSKSSAELDNLKTIDICWVDFGDKRVVDSLLFLIRSSPNLQELVIYVDSYISGEVENVCVAIAEEFLDWCFQHLRTVRINYLQGSKLELKMIEILLSCSPLLKVMSIIVDSKLDNNAKLEVSKELMQFRRSSTTAQIICTFN